MKHWSCLPPQAGQEPTPRLVNANPWRFHGGEKRPKAKPALVMPQGDCSVTEASRWVAIPTADFCLDPSGSPAACQPPCEPNGTLCR